MNTWNAFLLGVFLAYIGVEVYVWRKHFSDNEETEDGHDES